MAAAVTITLQSDVALVLFELLARTAHDDTLSLVHRGERVALWQLEGTLERLLVEPFREDYIALVAAARDRLVPEDHSDGV